MKSRDTPWFDPCFPAAKPKEAISCVFQWHCPAQQTHTHKDCTCIYVAESRRIEQEITLYLYGKCFCDLEGRTLIYM